MRNTIALLSLAFVLPSAASAQLADDGAENVEPVEVVTPHVDAALVEQAVVLLSAYHALPTRDQLVAALGDSARDVLWFVLDSDDANALVRDRALVALAGFPDEQLRVRLEQIVADRSEANYMDRQRAIAAHARAFGDASIDLLVTLFDEPDRDSQITAIHALREVGTPAARAALESVLGDFEAGVRPALVIEHDDIAGVLERWTTSVPGSAN